MVRSTLDLIKELENLYELQSKVYQKMHTVIPPEMPEKIDVMRHLTEGMFWLRLVIDLVKMPDPEFRLRDDPNDNHLPGN